MIATLEEEMRKAAKKMEFEKAAELRNMIDDLRSTTRPMRRFTAWQSAEHNRSDGGRARVG